MKELAKWIKLAHRHCWSGPYLCPRPIWSINKTSRLGGHLALVAMTDAPNHARNPGLQWRLVAQKGGAFAIFFHLGENHAQTNVCGSVRERIGFISRR